VSSFESDFNADFNVWLTEDQQRTGDYEYNYERGSALQMNGDDGPVAEIAAMTGTDVATYTRDRPGMSAFIVEDGAVYHSYFDVRAGRRRPLGHVPVARSPKGHNESGIWWRRHDAYEKG
jgi:predicted dithiol-disulfide oxidoreductase (DUF899 family)